MIIHEYREDGVAIKTDAEAVMTALRNGVG
jgi:hypothetical protein